MAMQSLETIVRQLVADSEVLARDESIPTCNQRLAKFGILQTLETRRTFRDLIVSTPNLESCFSGEILCDEPFRQKTKPRINFAEAVIEFGIISGIKVDRGAKAMAGHAGETITERLDGIRVRLTEYAKMGARFSKWRGVFARAGRQ